MIREPERERLEKARELMTEVVKSRIDRYGTDAIKALLASWEDWDKNVGR